ncbi:hypothetical protein PR202_gb12154 [Eleusine coracana subsp. coracana]|uniref:RNase H type-1 domain-containing protein n=1 Tax=Eleusine coracana subsp. coracana TaxID=191504 RepID=A0AAV5EPA2_ELECO|nr:hypothetical protein PR202_gb12154 [Eleusine coracana subsp. coracana]
MVLLTSWRAIFQARSAMEVEAMACLEGVRLAVEWCHQPAILESDCSALVGELQKETSLRSQVCFIERETLEFGRLLPELKIRLVRREQNSVEDKLAHLAKRTTHTAVWHMQVP